MNFRQFAIGLTASFGVAWIAMVIIPFFKLRNPSPVSFQQGVDTEEGIYHPKRSGRVLNGYLVYAENGCYQCHTMVVRPTYAGKDLGRPDFGGLSKSVNPDGVDTRRESNVFDYTGLDFAPIGVTRIGPDLMNFGRRFEMEYGADARKELMMHLYDPRLDPEYRTSSSCPSLSFLFEKKKITGQRLNEALDVPVKDGWQVVPGQKVESLVSFLLSLKHDDPVPASMNFSPADESSDEG